MPILFDHFLRFLPMPILGIPGGIGKNWHKSEKIGLPPPPPPSIHPTLLNATKDDVFRVHNVMIS